MRELRVSAVMRSTRLRLAALAQALRDGRIEPSRAGEELERLIRRETRTVERYVKTMGRRMLRGGSFAAHSARD